MMRHCDFYKATNGKWYMELADEEYGERYDATTYGPFDSEDAAKRYLDQFSNPGGYSTDDSGEQPVPTKSPNGGSVIAPKGRSRY
jgi:hypothetical protein